VGGERKAGENGTRQRNAGATTNPLPTKCRRKDEKKREPQNKREKDKPYSAGDF